MNLENSRRNNITDTGLGNLGGGGGDHGLRDSNEDKGQFPAFSIQAMMVRGSILVHSFG